MAEDNATPRTAPLQLADLPARIATDRDRSVGVRAVLVDAQELARRLGVSRAFVYEHAHELGVIRLGRSPRARLRFDTDRALEALSARSASRRSQAGEHAVPVGSPRGSSGEPLGRDRELLPIGRIRHTPDVGSSHDTGRIKRS
jgi:hypothetical protein